MLDAKRLYGNLEKSWNELEAEKLPKFTLYDAEQKRIDGNDHLADHSQTQSVPL